MKRILLSTVVIIGVAFNAYADHGAHDVILDVNQVKIKVKGVVCSFCAHGTKKKLSKLHYVQPKRDSGVEIDIDKQQITLNLIDDKFFDLKDAYQSIKRGGYEPEIVYMRVAGKLQQTDGRYFLHDEKSNLFFELNQEDATRIEGVEDVSLDIHFDPSIIPSITPHDPIAASIDSVVKEEANE